MFFYNSIMDTRKENVTEARYRAQFHRLKVGIKPRTIWFIVSALILSPKLVKNMEKTFWGKKKQVPKYYVQDDHIWIEKKNNFET